MYNYLNINHIIFVQHILDLLRIIKVETYRYLISYKYHTRILDYKL